MKADPGVAERVTRAIAPPPPDTLPEWIDPEDRTAVNLYRETQQVRARADAAEARLTANSEAERRSHVVDSFRAAVGQFKTKHPNLSDEQIAAVADATGKANIIEGLERTEGSLAAAFDRGMEMTMWSDPGLRSLALADQSTTVRSDDKTKDRKAKQAALSPSGSAGGRAEPPRSVPKTRDELMDAMLADVRASMAD